MIISSFEHPAHQFLSNFYPVTVIYGDIIYPSVEHAYQAQKVKDRDSRMIIAAAPTPGKAKRLGRKLKMRKDWERVKVSIMLDLIRLKFTPGRKGRLATKLLYTDPHILVEGNDWGDTFWGQVDGKGLNMLGVLLMIRRTELGGSFSEDI